MKKRIRNKWQNTIVNKSRLGDGKKKTLSTQKYNRYVAFRMIGTRFVKCINGQRWQYGIINVEGEPYSLYKCIDNIEPNVVYAPYILATSISKDIADVEVGDIIIDRVFQRGISGKEAKEKCGMPFGLIHEAVSVKVLAKERIDYEGGKEINDYPFHGYRLTTDSSEKYNWDISDGEKVNISVTELPTPTYRVLSEEEMKHINYEHE